MRKWVLFICVWTWTTLDSPAAEREPFDLYRPPCPTSTCQSDCDQCQTCIQRSRLAARMGRMAGQSCDCCPSCGQPWPASGCGGGDACDQCRKERKWINVARWLCYVPTRTRCDKQPEPCCLPPMYLYFTCCQPCGPGMCPPPGCAPAIGGGKPAGCQGCQ